MRNFFLLLLMLFTSLAAQAINFADLPNKDAVSGLKEALN